VTVLGKISTAMWGHRLEILTTRDRQFTIMITVWMEHYGSIRPVIALPVPNILSTCKAEEGGDAVASLADSAVRQWHTFNTDRSGA